MADDSTSVSTICFPIGPFMTLPGDDDDDDDYGYDAGYIDDDDDDDD